MKEIGHEELRELQMCILDEVDKFCRNHHIRYTMSGGTLLGAVRHKGFIPWDDDMDIQMPREDYLRFTQMWNGAGNSRKYLLVSIESGNNMGYAYGKMTNPRTVTFIKGMERTGVYIDIFPVDSVKDYDDFTIRRAKERKLYRQRRGLLWRKLAKYGHVPFWRVALAYLRSPHFPSKTLNQVVEEINRNAQARNGEDCPWYFEMVSGFKCKDLIPAAVFDDYIDLPFEDRRYMSVADHDEYLRKTFGDYMQLPPPEERVRNHAFKAYWKGQERK